MEGLVGKEPRNCLVVDDEPFICQTIGFVLETEGWNVRACTDLASAKEAARKGPYDLALVDIKLGRRSGLDLLPVLKAEQPGTPVIIITAYASIPGAVGAVRLGAADYLPKPFNPEELRRAVAQAVAGGVQRGRGEGLSARPLLESRVPLMEALLERVRKVARSATTTVLLEGETGTGKGVLAKAIHDLGPRRGGPFVLVSCPALPLEMLESELFGYVRGAFTGAYRDHEGKLAQAEGGTLFLDEIGDLPLALQAKLLRVLQEREYERLGGSATLKADVRVVAATNVDLAAAVAAGTFRQDLYYRLSAVELRVPPLRQRREDLPRLVESMLEDVRSEVGRGPSRFSAGALARLRDYDWPGNLRELRNLLERVCVMGEGDEVGPAELARLFTEEAPAAAADPGTPGSMEEVEAAHIRRVLSQTSTLEEASRVLGLSAVTLWRKRKKYGL